MLSCVYHLYVCTCICKMIIHIFSLCLHVMYVLIYLLCICLPVCVVVHLHTYIDVRVQYFNQHQSMYVHMYVCPTCGVLHCLEQCGMVLMLM